MQPTIAVVNLACRSADMLGSCMCRRAKPAGSELDCTADSSTEPWPDLAPRLVSTLAGPFRAVRLITPNPLVLLLLVLRSRPLTFFFMPMLALLVLLNSRFHRFLAFLMGFARNPMDALLWRSIRPRVTGP